MGERERERAGERESERESERERYQGGICGQTAKAGQRTDADRKGGLGKAWGGRGWSLLHFICPINPLLTNVVYQITRDFFLFLFYKPSKYVCNRRSY